MWWLASCALFPPDVVPCAQTADCRTAFGLGSTCTPDGFCAAPEVPARCQETQPPGLYDDPEAASTYEVIGALFDLGPDTQNLRSGLLALTEANTDGGESRPVAAVICSYNEDPELDGQDSLSAAQEGARWLAEVLEVPVILGPGTSSATEAIFPVTNAQDTLLVSPSATSPALVTLDGELSTDAEPGLFWRSAPPDDAQGLAILVDVSDRAIDGLAVIYQDDAYGAALASIVLEGRPDALALPYSDNNARSAAIGAAGADASVQEVVFISAEVQQVVDFLNSAALLDTYASKSFFLTDAASYSYLFEATTPAAQALFPRVRGSRPQTPRGPYYDAFVVSYASAYEGQDPTSDAYNAYAYDAGWMILWGLEWARANEADLSGTSLARGLRRISGPGLEVAVGPASLAPVRQAFAQGDAVDVVGATGPLDFDPTTGETRNAVEIWGISDGDFVVLRVCSPDGACLDA